MKRKKMLSFLVIISTLFFSFAAKAAVLYSNIPADVQAFKDALFRPGNNHQDIIDLELSGTFTIDFPLYHYNNDVTITSPDSATIIFNAVAPDALTWQGADSGFEIDGGVYNAPAHSLTLKNITFITKQTGIVNGPSFNYFDRIKINNVTFITDSTTFGVSFMNSNNASIEDLTIIAPNAAETGLDVRAADGVSFSGTLNVTAPNVSQGSIRVRKFESEESTSVDFAGVTNPVLLDGIWVELGSSIIEPPGWINTRDWPNNAGTWYPPVPVPPLPTETRLPTPKPGANYIPNGSTPTPTPIYLPTPTPTGTVYIIDGIGINYNPYATPAPTSKENLKPAGNKLQIDSKYVYIIKSKQVAQLYDRASLTAKKAFKVNALSSMVTYGGRIKNSKGDEFYRVLTEDGVKYVSKEDLMEHSKKPGQYVLQYVYDSAKISYVDKTVTAYDSAKAPKTKKGVAARKLAMALRNNKIGNYEEIYEGETNGFVLASALEAASWSDFE